MSAWRLFLKMGGWAVIWLGAALLFLTFAGQYQLGLAERFEAEGRQATAIVTDKRVRTSNDREGRRKVTRYLGFEFVTDAGETIAVTRSVSAAEYRKAVVGEPLDIWYLESDPGTTEITPGSHARGAHWVQILGLLVGLAWLALLWHVGRKVVEALRARRFGAVELAEVTEVSPTSARVNKRPLYRLQWRDAQGRSGQSLPRNAEDLRGLQPGSRIRIYRGTKRSWWAGDIGDRSE